jgi:NDP-sugar pyrophosphorylase family protein
MSDTRSGPELFPVVILAGGIATRLRPLTETIPKALVDINGEPFIAHQLRLLRARGVSRVVVCAGYKGEMIQAFVGNGAAFGLHVDFVFDGPHLLGTAGAVKKALPNVADACFVLYGDSYLTCDYGTVQVAFEQSRCLGLMTVFRNQGRWDRSNIEFAGGRIVAYDKRAQTAQMHYIDYGLGVFRTAAFHHVPDDQPHDLAAVYQHLLRIHQLAGHEVGERFYEIGSFEGLEETRRFLATHRQQGAHGPP